MKNKILIFFILFLFIAPFLYGQTEKKNHFTISVESPLFYKDWYGDRGNVGFVNFEYFNKKSKHFTNSYSFGVMFLSKINDTLIFPDPVFNLQYTALYGNNTHFLEIGIGAVFPGLLMNLRIGYRLNIKKHFLFRIAYTPSIYLVPHQEEQYYPKFTVFHGLSVGLGYRFGIQQGKKDKTNGKRLVNNSMSVSVESPLFFKDWHGRKGSEGFINFEYLDRRNEHFGNSYSIGLLFIAHLYDETFTPFPIINLQYNAVFGHHTNFFETGVGFIVPDFILNLRFGYRLHIKKHFLFKIAYTPSIYLEPWEDSKYYRNFTGLGLTGFHALSIGFGYRFGLHGKKKR